MQKIILYYKFTPIENPELVKLWQKAVCEKLNLKGRILISTHGINGTLGGEVEDLKEYIKANNEFKGFLKTVYKWSDGGRDDFPRLSVKARKEIVAFGAPDEVKVNEKGIVGGGIHLNPARVHELVEQYGDNVVFFDGRNAYEAQIGKFKNAVVPDTRTTHDFLTELESGKYDWMKDKHVITYCTGGVRCEILSPLMKNRGFKNVYQIDGGIVKYGEEFGDSGLWEGSLYVFDKRMALTFSEESKLIGSCSYCKNATDNFENCAYTLCNRLILVCSDCLDVRHKVFHSDECEAEVAAGARSR